MYEKRKRKWKKENKIKDPILVVHLFLLVEYECVASQYPYPLLYWQTNTIKRKVKLRTLSLYEP